MQKVLSVFVSFFFALKAKLKLLKFLPAICLTINWMSCNRMNLQLTGNMSLKLDPNSSLVLEYDRKSSIVWVFFQPVVA